MMLEELIDKILFKQERVGENGESFMIYKIRTMDPDVEVSDERLRNAWNNNPYGKVEDDPRITPWGKYLRRWGIDEIPQLVNVCKGEMSVVGPRPVTPEVFETWPDSFQERWIDYKPGLVPPYLAEGVSDPEDILECSIEYFDRKDENPVLTDVSYLVRGVYNFLTGRVKTK